jgi:long-chain fatty acid transport protein
MKWFAFNNTAREPPMRNRFHSQILMLLGALLAASGSARAQTADVVAGIQLNLSTPGARSLGLGGAFVGLADDATAAYANPAGLTVLSDPEVSFEGRSTRFNNTFVQKGRTFGDPTGRGIDTVAGLVTGENEETVSGASFLSAVYPGRQWAVALYRHELANYRASFRTDGVFASLDGRTRPKDNLFDLAITGLGLSAAYRFGDRLSVGAGVVSYNFSLLARTERYRISGGPNAPGANEPGGLFGPSLFTPENLVDTQIQTGDERRTGFNAGFRYKVSSNWTLGGVYRRGPELRLDSTIIRGPAAEEDLSPEPLSARYSVPDILGAGVAYQPTEFFTVTLDYVHVEYSDLTNGLVGIVLIQSELTREAPFFKVDDAGEIRLGIESVIPYRRSLLALRAGSWYDPAHRIRYEGQVPGLRAAFQPGEDEIHYTAGFGFILPRWKARADVAFDYSDPIKTASFSTVLYF